MRELTNKRRFADEPTERNVQATVVYDKIQAVWDEQSRKNAKAESDAEKVSYIVSLQGSARSGKTYNTTIWYCVHAYNTPNTRVVVVRATMPRIKKTCYKDFEDVMRALGIWESKRMNKVEMTYTFQNGSEVQFFATEDSGAAQGLKSDILFVNEATEIGYEVWVQLTVRNQGLKILDYNPNFSDDHWIAKMNRTDKDVKFFKTTYKDNIFLSSETVKSIEKLKYTDERLWRIYGLGEQSLVEGVIYKQWNIVPSIPPNLMRKAIVGLDWGWQDPTAIVLVAVTKDECYVQEICYKPYMKDDEILEILQTYPCKGRQVICDNADPRMKDKMKRDGVRIQATRKASSANMRSIVPGIVAVLSKKLYIVEGSDNLITELNNYTWAQDRDGNYTDQPIDKFNHLLDATRYVVYTYKIEKQRGITIR